MSNMIRMREVRRPEKAVTPYDLDDGGYRLFIRVSRDPALPLKIGARRFLHPCRLAERHSVHGVHAIEQIADPTRLRFQHHHLYFGEPIEESVVKERDKGLHHALRYQNVHVPREAKRIALGK